LTLLDFATERYSRPGVKEAMLALQDAHGQSVPLLFWALWARCEDDQIIAMAVRLAREWEADVIGPLRGVRRKLNPRVFLHDTEPRQALYTRVQEAELGAEGVLLDALAALAPPQGGALPTQAMARACQAWGDPPPAEQLARLAALVG
jgi:uncharacterized protein (TIGR02444 family)